MASCLDVGGNAHPNPDIITTLVKSGAVLDGQDESGRTALMWAAAANRNPEVIVALLKIGANPKIRSNEGQTAFDYAKYNMRLKVLTPTGSYLN